MGRASMSPANAVDEKSIGNFPTAHQQRYLDIGCISADGGGAGILPARRGAARR